MRVWRDWLTEEVVRRLNITDRQQEAIRYLKTNREIGNTEYQAQFKVAKRTAHRDLTELVELGILERIGTRGKGISCAFCKGATKGPIGPRVGENPERAIKGPIGPSTLRHIEKDVSTSTKPQSPPLIKGEKKGSKGTSTPRPPTKRPKK